MRRRTSYFWFILRNYLLAVLLPVLILCFMLYRVGVVELLQAGRSSRAAHLNTVAAVLDQRMAECSDIAMLMSMEDSLLGISDHLSTEEAIAVIQRLARYTSTNAFFHKIIIMREGVSLIYTSQGTLSRQVLYQDFLHLSGEEALLFEECEASAESRIQYFPTADLVIRFVPFPLLNSVKKGCAAYVMEKTQLMGLMELCLDEPDCALLLADSENRLLYGYNALGLELDIQAIRENQANAYVNVDGVRCMLSCQTISEAGWTILWLRPMAAFVEDMRLSVIVTGTAAALIIAGLLIITLSRSQYQPIHRLSSLSGKNSPNELVNIQRAVCEYRDVLNKVDRQRQQLRDNLMLRLLGGEAFSQQELRQMCDALEFFRDGQEAVVVLAQFAAANAQTVRSEAERRMFANNEGCVLCMGEGICMICSKDGEDQLQSDLYEFEQWFLNTWGCVVRFGISNSHPLYKLSTGLLEAQTALCQTKATRPDNVAFYQDARVTPPQLDENARRNEHRFACSLRQGDEVMALQALDQWLECLRGQDFGRSMQVYYQFRIAETIAHVVTDDAVAGYLSAADFEKMSPLLTSTLTNVSLEEFAQCAREIVGNVCGIMRAVEQRKQQNQRQVACAWVHDNLSNPELSLELLSSDMGCSPAYWSRFFRERIGINFNDYVWNLRCETCKRLLSQTSLPIKQIVQDVGYVDASSFTRRFRQQEGVTPGQYREQHPEKECADNGPPQARL